MRQPKPTAIVQIMQLKAEIGLIAAAIEGPALRPIIATDREALRCVAFRMAKIADDLEHRHCVEQLSRPLPVRPRPWHERVVRNYRAFRHFVGPRRAAWMTFSAFVRGRAEWPPPAAR
jgi:hypothetical protein